MHKETQAVIENVSRLINDFRNDHKEECWFDRLEILEKYLLSIEDSENA